jgi:hypothetical protein
LFLHVFFCISYFLRFSPSLIPSQKLSWIIMLFFLYLFSASSCLLFLFLQHFLNFYILFCCFNPWLAYISFDYYLLWCNVASRDPAYRAAGWVPRYPAESYTSSFLYPPTTPPPPKKKPVSRLCRRKRLFLSFRAKPVLSRLSVSPSLIGSLAGSCPSSRPSISNVYLHRLNFCPEDGGGVFPLSGAFVPDYTASYSKRHSSLWPSC